MIILWIKGPDKDEPRRGKESDNDDFRKHDERMKRFRVAHPKKEPEKPREANSMDYLVPVRRVKLNRYLCN